MNNIIFKTILLKGESGAISGIEKTNTSGLVDTYTITYNDGTTATFEVTNGKGITSVTKTATNGLVDTYTITYGDGTTSTFTVTNAKSISSVTKTSTSGLTYTYTITYNDEDTSTFDIKNGRGITRIQRTSTDGLIDTYTITYNDGTTSTFTVTNGANSSDDNLATVETHPTATRAYAKGEHIILNGVYYVTKNSILQGATLTEGTNIERKVIGDELTNLQNATKRVSFNSTSGKTEVLGDLEVSSDVQGDSGYFDEVFIDADSQLVGTNSALYGGRSSTKNGDTSSNSQNVLNIFGGHNESNLTWFGSGSDSLTRGALLFSLGLPRTNYKDVSGNIDLTGENLGAFNYKYEARRQYGYSGLLDGTNEADIMLDACGTYLLRANAFTISSGDIYGATVRLITAHAGSGTPNILQLGQTSNAPCTITASANNMLKIANGANTRGTQYNLIRIM